MRNTNTISLHNVYQKIGTPIPEGMIPSEALQYAGLAGWDQRTVTPTVLAGTEFVDVGNARVLIADIPQKDGTVKPTLLGHGITSQYTPIQHEEAYLPVLDGFGEAGLVPDTMGAWNNGRRSYALFRLPEGRGEVRTSEGGVGSYILVDKHNDGKGAVVASVVSERVWCANMITSLLRGAVPAVRVRHTRSGDPYVLATAQSLLGLADEWAVQLGKEIRRLETTTMTRSKWVDKVVPTLLGDRPEEKGRSQSIFDRKFYELVGSWDSSTAPEDATAWRGYNAVTEYLQHTRTGSRVAEAAVAGRGAGLVEHFLSLV